MLQCHGVDAADTFTWSGSHGNCGRGASEIIFSVRGAPSWYKKVCRQLVTMLRAVWYDSMRDVSSQSVRLRRRPVTCWWVTLPVVKDFFQASSSTRIHITLLIWAPLTPARPGILYKQRCRAAWRYFELRLEGGEPIDIGFGCCYVLLVLWCSNGNPFIHITYSCSLYLYAVYSIMYNIYFISSVCPSPVQTSFYVYYLSLYIKTLSRVQRVRSYRQRVSTLKPATLIFTVIHHH